MPLRRIITLYRFHHACHEPPPRRARAIIHFTHRVMSTGKKRQRRPPRAGFAGLSVPLRVPIPVSLPVPIGTFGTTVIPIIVASAPVSTRTQTSAPRRLCIVPSNHPLTSPGCDHDDASLDHIDRHHHLDRSLETRTCPARSSPSNDASSCPAPRSP